MTGHPSLDIAITLLLAALFTISVWTATFFVLSRATGWRSLAERFPARPPATDAERGLTSITLGSLGNYNNCVLWASDEEGLHLRLPPVFNLFHPAMTIPWGEVARIEPLERGLRRGWVTLTLGSTRLTIPGKLARRELELRAQITEGGYAD